MRTYSEKGGGPGLTPSERNYLLASPITLVDVQSALGRYHLSEALFPLESEESRPQRLNELAALLFTFQPEIQEGMFEATLRVSNREKTVRSGRRGGLLGSTPELNDAKYDRRRIDLQVGKLSGKFIDASLKRTSQQVAEIKHALQHDVVGPIWLEERIENAYALLTNARQGIMIQKGALQIPDSLYPLRYPQNNIRLGILEHQLDTLDRQLQLIAARRSR